MTISNNIQIVIVVALCVVLVCTCVLGYITLRFMVKHMETCDTIRGIQKDMYEALADLEEGECDEEEDTVANTSDTTSLESPKKPNIVH